MNKFLLLFIMICPAMVFGQQVTNNTEAVLRRVADNVINNTSFRFTDPDTKEKFESTKGLPAGKVLRAESSFNKWGYPNGVLTIGLMQMAAAINDKKYAAFAMRNAAFIFDNLPYFEALYRSNTRVEYSAVFAMGSLDNTGAMSAGLTDVNYLADRKDYRAYLERSANYISNKQLRLADGTLARTHPREATIWADDMFMSIPFLARMGKLTGDNKYFADAIKQVEQFTKYLYDPSSGLYWHSYYTDVQTNGVAHWGRCNGWIAMSQVELLKNLPDNHPKKAELIKLLLRQIIGYSRYQDNSGLWHQLLDKPDSYLETSATAMFVYAIASAVNNGWINKRYIGIARDGWKALQTKITPVGEMQDVCVGTGIEENIRFYYTRPTPLNDTHGLGPLLMAGSEMLKFEKQIQK